MNFWTKLKIKNLLAAERSQSGPEWGSTDQQSYSLLPEPTIMSVNYIYANINIWKEEIKLIKLTCLVYASTGEAATKPLIGIFMDSALLSSCTHLPTELCQSL